MRTEFPTKTKHTLYPRPSRNLIRKREACEALTETHHVTIEPENNHRQVLVGQGILDIQNQVHIVDTRKVDGTGRLGRLGLQGPAHVVDEAIRDIGVELVREHQAEVTTLASIPAEVIEQDTGKLDRVLTPLARVVEPVVAELLALAAHHKDQLIHRVVEIQLNVELARTTARVIVLMLHNQLLERTRREPVTLLDVAINIHAIDTRGQIRRHQGRAVAAFHDDRVAIRDLDTIAELGKAEMQRDTVELHRHQRERLTRGISEIPRQRHVQATVILGIGHQLGASEAFANHLQQTRAGPTRQLLPSPQEIRVQRINHLTTDGERGLLDEELANRIGVVGPRTLQTSASVNDVAVAQVNQVIGGLDRGNHGTGADALGGRAITARVARVAARELVAADTADRSRGGAARNPGQIEHNVLVVDEIAGTVQNQLRVAAEWGRAVERLLNHFKTGIGVLVITETPQRDSRIAR